MRLLIGVVLLSLANMISAHAKDLNDCRPKGAKCSGDGKYLACMEERCDPPVDGQRKCLSVASTIYIREGKCVIMHRIATIIRPVEPPNTGPGEPDARCAKLTPAQRAETEGCH